MGRRWVKIPGFDRWRDSWGVYAPVGALDVEAELGRLALRTLTSRTADEFCTCVAVRRVHRCRPWKIAR